MQSVLLESPYAIAACSQKEWEMKIATKDLLEILEQLLEGLDTDAWRHLGRVKFCGVLDVISRSEILEDHDILEMAVERTAERLRMYHNILMTSPAAVRRHIADEKKKVAAPNEAVVLTVVNAQALEYEEGISDEKGD